MAFLLSHPSGNANVRQLALALAHDNALSAIATGLALATPPDQRWPKAWKRELNRRLWPATIATYLQPDPWPELLCLSLSRIPPLKGTRWPSRLTNWQARHHDLRVARYLRNRPHTSRLRAFYGYEDSACRSIQEARRQGLITYVELPTLHSNSVRRFQEQEAALRPSSRPLLRALHEPTWKLQRKHIELATADWIVVPSTLVRDSCVEAGLPTEKILVVPYGSPAVSYPQRPDTQSPIALYAGRLTPAKGLDHLLAAWSQINQPDAELWLVGGCSYPKRWLESLPNTVHWLGSIPHQELTRIYSQAQLLVLPSLADGYPLVVSEAMAMGLPVLLTDRCGNRDLIKHGLNGWIVPAADAAALAAVLAEALADPHRCRRMGAAAQTTVARHTWADYHTSINVALQATLKP